MNPIEKLKQIRDQYIPLSEVIKRTTINGKIISYNTALNYYNNGHIFPKNAKRDFQSKGRNGTTKMISKSWLEKQIKRENKLLDAR